MAEIEKKYPNAKFFGYEEYFSRVKEFCFIPRFPPEDTKKYFDKNIIIKLQSEYSGNTINHSFFEFMSQFLPLDIVMEYFKQFTKESITFDDDEEKYDLMHYLVQLTENINADDEEENEANTEKVDKVILQMMTHAHEVWKTPFTMDAIEEAFNFEMYDVVEYILSKNSNLLFDKGEDGKTLAETSSFKYGDSNNKIRKLVEYMVKYNNTIFVIDVEKTIEKIKAIHND